jgi:Ca2+-binding EF-hand superfamily protein
VSQLFSARCLWLPASILAIIGLSTPLFAADSPQSTNDSHRVVLLASSGPLLLDVRVQTGSQSIGQVRASFCESLFARLDADKSGKLEESEQSQVPTFRRSGGGAGEPVQKFLEGGALTLDGLRKYIDGQLGPEFAVEIKAPRLDQSVRLIDVLDRDGDGILSVDEVVNSGKLLARYDLDDDESLSVSELQPFPQSVRQAMRQQETQGGKGARIFSIVGDDAVARAASEIQKAFGDEKGLQIERCGLNRDAAAAFDKNQDGRLSEDELRNWVSTGKPDLNVNAQWRQGRLPPTVQVEAARVDRIEIPDVVSKLRWSAKVDGIPVEIKVRDNRFAADDAVRQLVTNARQRDADKNGYLSETEYAGLGAGAPFAAVDLNKDGMVYPDEIRQYFTDMSKLSQARVVLTFDDKIMSLFQLMDADTSNRLSPREMATLRERLAPMDRNHNGQFDPGDFVSQFDLTMAFKTPEGLEENGSAAMPAMGNTGGVRRTLRTGPVWYQRMDRNRDHDISWREFLGPRAKFDEVDTDHDGLISREDAEAADAKAKSESAAASQAAAAP